MSKHTHRACSRVAPDRRAAAGSHEPQTKDERHERIKDYLRSALAMEDPLAANVGAVNSDLMLFGYSLQRAITKAVPGGRLSDISHAVQSWVEAHGFSVVRDFVGHGIGRQLHEAPQLPNFGPPGQGPRLKPGMTLAIEPMINAGSPGVKILPDGWTAVTQDGKRSAHFEHTVAITEHGPEILTRV